MARLADIQQLLLQQGEASISSGGDHVFLRLRHATNALRSAPLSVGMGDIAILVRQALLREARPGVVGPEIRVPRGGGWPDEATWKSFGCLVETVGREHYVISPQPWSPTWLGRGASDVIDAAIKEEDRRKDRRVPADPLVTDLTGLKQYISSGQRAAVHAAFFIPSGSTAVISLPTGAGKTLAFQLPALAWMDQEGLTLVIVPTTALAKDHEGRFRQLLEHRSNRLFDRSSPFAYHTGLDGNSKSEILTRLREGKQSVLFASPEAVMGALRTTLFSIARQGRLRYFVVDEAHVVTQWGQQFRPEFQTIAGLRNALIEVCPLRSGFGRFL